MNRKPGDWNCASCDHLNFGWRESCQRCSDPKPAGDGYAKAGDSGFGGGRVDDRRRTGSYGFGSGYNSGGSGSSGSYYGRSQGGGGDYRGGYGDDNRGSYGGSDYNNRSYGGGFGGSGGSDLRPGDWHCQESGCGAHNFASRSSCFKCGAVKEEGGANGRGGNYDYGRGGGGGSGGGYDRGSRGGFGKSYDSGDTGGGGSGRGGWKSGDWMCNRPGCNEHNFASRTECFRCQAPREA